jgi:peroxiredoxin
MKLHTGMLAPTFERSDLTGTLRTSRPAQDNLLLLSFLRNAACALCNLRVHELIEHYPEFQQRGLEVLAIFESPEENIVQHVLRQNVPFPVIADPKGTLYDLYSVETSEEKVKATFGADWQNRLVIRAAEIGYPLTPEAGSNFYRLPADFLIDSDGRITAAYYSDAIGRHLKFETIEDLLPMVS